MSRPYTAAMTRVLTAVLLVATALTMQAHHSYAQFDRTGVVTIAGTVEEVVFANPHITFRVHTDAGEVFRVEWMSVLQVGRLGIQKDTFAAGDRLVITGAPHRDPAERYLTLLTEIRRPADGWLWAKPASSR
jgi:hypothetical protein